MDDDPRAAAGPARPRTPRGRWWRPVLLVGAVLLAGYELHDHLPSAAATWAALVRARPGWLLAALALQVISMGTFAEQQRRMLGAFGVRIPARVSLAVSYARSAMAAALPGGRRSPPGTRSGGSGRAGRQGRSPAR